MHDVVRTRGMVRERPDPDVLPELEDRVRVGRVRPPPRYGTGIDSKLIATAAAIARCVRRWIQ